MIDHLKRSSAAALIVHGALVLGALVLGPGCFAASAYAQLPSAVETRPPTEPSLPIRKPQMHFGSNAIVEVFCSTVVADCVQLLPAVRRLQSDFERQNAQVEIVVFHVGIMDTSAARDPFAEQLSDRKQRDYAELLRAKRVRVPQIFVNGLKTPVLLDGASIAASAVHALTVPATRKVLLQIEPTSAPDAFRVHYKVEGLPLIGKNPLEFLHVVQVQKHAVVKTKQPGKLEQVSIPLTNIVRSLDSVRIQGNVVDATDVIVPEGLTAGDMSIVAYVQDARTRKIFGSARVDLAGKGGVR